MEQGPGPRLTFEQTLDKLSNVTAQDLTIQYNNTPATGTGPERTTVGIVFVQFRILFDY